MMSTPTLHIPGAEETVIDHLPCGVCVSEAEDVLYCTAVPDRGLYVITGYSWRRNWGMTAAGPLIRHVCADCGTVHTKPDMAIPPLWRTQYGPESHVTRGGLLEAHENAVVLAVQNRLPLGGGSMQRGRQG